jgi:hypothetical protein
MIGGKMENTQQQGQPVEPANIKKLTFKEWEHEFGQGMYASTAKLTKEQYVAIKKKELRSQNAKRMFGVISNIAEKMTHNFRAGEMEGFGSSGNDENIMTRIGKQSQNKALHNEGDK